MEEEKAKRLVETGAELAGGAVAGALGFLAGGPAAAAAAGAGGVAITRVAKRLISEFSNRFLSNREKVRVETAAAFALSQVRDRLSAGHNGSPAGRA